MVDRDALIGAISMVVDDDRLIEIVNEADAADDPVAYLQLTYDNLNGNGKRHAESTSGVEIVPVVAHVRDPKTREIVDATIGYELKRTVGDVELYAGVTLSWGPRYKSIPFLSTAEANNAARVWLEFEGQRISRAQLVRQTLLLHVAQGIREQTKPQQFNVRLTLEETNKMEAILAGLRAQNLEVSDKPVDSYPDVLRWLLKQIQVA